MECAGTDGDVVFSGRKDNLSLKEPTLCLYILAYISLHIMMSVQPDPGPSNGTILGEASILSDRGCSVPLSASESRSVWSNDPSRVSAQQLHVHLYQCAQQPGQSSSFPAVYMLRSRLTGNPVV